MTHPQRTPGDTKGLHGPRGRKHRAPSHPVPVSRRGKGAVPDESGRGLLMRHLRDAASDEITRAAFGRSAVRRVNNLPGGLLLPTQWGRGPLGEQLRQRFMNHKEHVLLNIRNNVKSLARRQYADDALAQARYENALLWEKFGELFHAAPELLEHPAASEPPKAESATVIDLASKTVIQPSEVST